MPELTRKRNLCYNLRHRDYHKKDNSMDIDSVEFDDQGNTLALVESKFGLVTEVDLNSLQFEVLCRLAREEFPVFCIIYYPLNADGQLVDANDPYESMSHIQFIGIGVNQLGRRYLPRRERLTEIQWVTLLAKLHGHPVDDPTKYYDTWIHGVGNIPHFINRPTT